ncbi:MAG: 3-oxoacyl-ACP synthase, partial [Nannocystaceae bacterium]
MIHSFEIRGTGICMPSRVVTNHDLESMVDTSDQWIVERTGISERRIATPNTSTSDLIAPAVRNACQDAGIAVEEVDTIIVATSTPDTMFPSTACWVQERLGVRGPAALDVAAGCTGWLYALELGG